MTDTQNTATQNTATQNTATQNTATQNTATQNTATQNTASPRAQTLAAQRLVNRLMRGLLRTPGLCRLVGRRLITVYAVGRVSGRQYTVPVAYEQDGDALLFGTPFAWGRNLRTGEPVEIRLRGRRRPADVVVRSDEAGVVEAYDRMCRANRAFARFNRIEFDVDGNPDPADLHAAWASGARAVWLTPR